MKSTKKYLSYIAFLALTFIGLTLIANFYGAQASPIPGRNTLLLAQSDGIFNQKSALFFYLIVLCLFIGWTLGHKIGFITNVLCYIGGYILAIMNNYLNEPIMNLLSNLGFDDDSYVRIGASLAILILFLILLKLVDNLLKTAAKMAYLKTFDSFLGAILGVIEASVAIGAFYYFLEIYEAKKSFGINIDHFPFSEMFKHLAESVLGSTYRDWIKDFVDILPV